MSGVRCDNCRIVNFGEATVCKRCGAHLSWTSKAPSAKTYGGIWDPAKTPGYLQEPSRAREKARARHSARNTLIAILALGLAAGLVGYVSLNRDGPKGVEWREYRSSEGSYTVMMPGQPVESTRDETTKNGVVKTRWSTVEFSENEFCIVGWADFPAGNLQGYEDELLEKGMQGFIKNTKSILESKRWVTVWGHPGIEYETNLPVDKFPRGHRLICRMCWVNNRLYIMAVAGPESEKLITERSTFFLSFKPGAEAPRAPEPNKSSVRQASPRENEHQPA